MVFSVANPMVSLSSFGLDKKMENEGGKREKRKEQWRRQRGRSKTRKVRITPTQTGPGDLVFTGKGFKGGGKKIAPLVGGRVRGYRDNRSLLLLSTKN